jgi:hypothetical protein
MRKAINENPVVQIVLIGVLAVFVAFLLFTRVMSRGGAEEAAPTTAAPATDASVAGGTAPAPAAATDPATTAAPTAPAPGSTAPSTGAAPPASDAAPDSGFEAGPGLPRPVVSAYEDGKAVVLLIAKQKGIDDRAVRGSVERLRGRSEVALFVVPAKDVARYARITEGVQLDRVPAIVVVRPKRLSEGMPEATVSYGFRGPDSVDQAVEDALFDGKTVTYDP